MFTGTGTLSPLILPYFLYSYTFFTPISASPSFCTCEMMQMKNTFPLLIVLPDFSICNATDVAELFHSS